MEKLEDILREGLKLMGQEVAEDALRRFRIYYERLTEVGSVMNLTAIKGEGPVATLHFLDSAALLRYADFSGARVLDVGTGAGFPGLPLAILRSDARFTLLDSQQKRIDFLQDTVSRLGLKNVECVCLRAEEAPPVPGELRHSDQPRRGEAERARGAVPALCEAGRQLHRHESSGL